MSSFLTTIENHFSDSLLRDLSHGRNLDHARPEGAPQNGPAAGRAPETKEGYCIEYRESLDDHFKRYGMVWKTKPISVFEIGMDRGIYILTLGLQARKGDRTMEEPSILNIPKHAVWE